MVEELEERIYKLVRKHYGFYLFKRPILTPETDFDSDLKLDDDEAEKLMNEFFEKFNVDRGNFNINSYYPEQPSNLLKTLIPVPVPDFKIRMLIESAKAGRWLYD